MGAHFERLVFGNETMVAEDTPDSRFSKFSLAVARDSGWFEADLSSAEFFDWGLGAGCGFVQNPACPPELCPAGHAMTCSPDLFRKLTCSKTEFTDGCRIGRDGADCRVASGGSFYETFGVDSRCHLVEANSQVFSGCVQIECSPDASFYFVHFHRGIRKVSLKCDEVNKRILLSGSPLSIVCKHHDEYCQKKTPCDVACRDR